MGPKFINYKGVQYGIHFGIEFLEFFCGERKRQLNDIQSEGDINITKDLIYSLIRAYAELNGIPYNLKPINEWGLMVEVVKDESIMESFNKSLEAVLPEQKVLPESPNAKKKK